MRAPRAGPWACTFDDAEPHAPRKGALSKGGEEAERDLRLSVKQLASHLRGRGTIELIAAGRGVPYVSLRLTAAALL